MSIEDIKLRKVDEPEEKKLPRGVCLMRLGEQFIFLRNVMGKLMPVSHAEQEELCQRFLRS